MTDVVLEVQSVQAGYGDLTILHGVDLQVAACSWTTIIGANGAGKSTLLKVVAGLLACRTGHLRFEGQDITRLDALARLRGGIGLVPQGRCNFPALSVSENLQLGAYSRRLPRQTLMEEANAMADRFPRLRARWNTLAGNLSGGEQQILEMAMVLMARPRLLLLDEPSLGLSPQAMDMVFDTIRELTASGMTVLMVEQNAQQALERCDAGVVMEMGRVSLHAPAREVLNHPEIRAIFLGLT